jgi:hypothetical protein
MHPGDELSMDVVTTSRKILDVIDIEPKQNTPATHVATAFVADCEALSSPAGHALVFVSGQEVPDEMQGLNCQAAILENLAELTENASAQGKHEKQRDHWKIHPMPRNDSRL